jgi:hypothetical protein
LMYKAAPKKIPVASAATICGIMPEYTPCIL